MAEKDLREGGRLFPTFRIILGSTPSGIINILRFRSKKERWQRRLQRSKLAKLEQQLCDVIWPELESSVAPLLLGIDEIESSGLVDTSLFIRILAQELKEKGRSDAVKSAFYQSVLPSALATMTADLIRERNKE